MPDRVTLAVAIIPHLPATFCWIRTGTAVGEEVAEGEADAEADADLDGEGAGLGGSSELTLPLSLYVELVITTLGFSVIVTVLFAGEALADGDGVADGDGAD